MLLLGRSVEPMLFRALRVGYVFLIGVAVLLAVIPLLDGPTEDTALEVGASAFIALLIWLLPMWTAPVSIFTKSTMQISGDTLSAETCRRQVVLDLNRVRRVWACRMSTERGGVVFLGMHAEGGLRVWLSWPDRAGLGSGLHESPGDIGVGIPEGLESMLATQRSHWARATSARVQSATFDELIGGVIAGLAANPEVSISPGARALFALPDAPTGLTRVVLWLKGLALFLVIVVGVGYAAVGYVTLAMTI